MRKQLAPSANLTPILTSQNSRGTRLRPIRDSFGHHVICGQRKCLKSGAIRNAASASAMLQRTLINIRSKYPIKYVLLYCIATNRAVLGYTIPCGTRAGPRSKAPEPTHYTFHSKVQQCQISV